MTIHYTVVLKKDEHGNEYGRMTFRKVSDKFQVEVMRENDGLVIGESRPLPWYFTLDEDALNELEKVIRLVKEKDTKQPIISKPAFATLPHSRTAFFSGNPNGNYAGDQNV